MKKFRKAVALLLVVCMLTSGNMSLFANAAESNSVSEIGTDMFYRVFHLDAARKYFSADEIIEFIDIAAEGGYNQLELYLADNQGFRLALDDMIVTANGKTYDLTPSLGAGYNHAPHYTDGKNKWLTQDEMDDIIAYANSKGIGIVPCINAPGHMGAILESFPQFWYSTELPATRTLSKDLTTADGTVYPAGTVLTEGTEWTSHSALDLQNEEAYAFGQALVEKYATYFESRGIKYLNIGADEYGADMMTDNSYGTDNGMDLLYDEGGYDDFVRFVNEAAATIKSLGMTPRAYNDCIYYTGADTYNGESIYFDTDIEICYWNDGWGWGNYFRRADSTYLAGKGFKMINTNGNYYHVLGDANQKETSVTVTGFIINDFHNSNVSADPYDVKTIDNPAGAMFCIWCDDARDVSPNDNTGTTRWVIDSTKDTIIAFGQNVLSQKAPVTKTVELEVGETYTETFKGKPTVAYEAMDPTIAEQTTTVNEGDKEVGSVVTGTMKSGAYYLGNDIYGYLKVNENGQPEMVSADKAVPWTVTIASDGAVTMQQGEYYLDCYYHDTYYMLQCVVTKTPQNEYDYFFGANNKIYEDYDSGYLFWHENGNEKWLAASASPTNYIQPYEVIDPTTTTITFDANKKGTTYAYIGDVEYTINVTSDEPELQTEVIDLKEGETVGITVDGDVRIDYNTDNTDIATVTTSLDDGKVPGNMFTDSMVAGEYYLFDGDKYLIERDGTWAMVDAAQAKPWTVTIDGTTGAATITQGDNYYLTTIPNTTTNYFDVKILKDKPATYPIAFKKDLDNALYISFTDGNDWYIYWDTQGDGYLGAKTVTTVDYFSPYTVEVGVDPATNIVFDGKKEGTTYVTIGNVRYTINVSAAEVVEPDPEPGVDEVITIEVGESYTWPDLIAGDVTGDHPTKDTTIATVIAAPGAVETTYSVGNPVTSDMVDGSYYLYDGTNYLVIKNNDWAIDVEANAKPWNITISSDKGALIEQSGYYLSNYTDTAGYPYCDILQTEPESPYIFNAEYQNAFYYNNAIMGDIYIFWDARGWVGAQTYVEGNSYFRPYEVVENKITTATSLTFRGHKVGTTFVTIDGVTYQINVTKGAKVIEVKEGEYVEITANGVITGTYPTDDTTIATAIVVGAGEPIKMVGSPVTTAMISGEYYIGAQGKYLIVNENGKFAMVDADEAIPWNVSVSDSTTQSVIMRQGEYIFSNISSGTGGYYIQPLDTEPTYETRFDSENDLYIVSPDSGVWHYVRWGENQYVVAGAHSDDTLIPEYFGPYEVETTTTGTTVLSFYGHSVGETYVTIGDVDYTIKVIKNDNLKEETINLKVNQIYNKEVSGDVSGVYLTDDTTIATVITQLTVGETITTVGDPVTTTITNGDYYIGNGSQFLIVKGGTATMVGAEEAIPWKVVTTDVGVVVKQGNYYLSNYISDEKTYCNVSLTGAALAYNFDVDKQNALWYNYTNSNSESVDYYIYWNATNGWIVAEAETDGTGANETAYFRPYAVNSTTPAVTNLSFYGYKEGTTTVIIGDTKYIITVEEEQEETINITIPLGEEVVYKQPLNVLDADLPEDEYVDIDLLYRRQDAYSWVSNPQANQSYYIMGIEQHYLAIEDGKLVTVENPTADQKWTVIPKVGGYSLKYGDYYLVNHWHDGVMTLEFLEEDTSAFPWQFDQNRGIYCTDKVESYRLAHNPITHEWELNEKTTRRIGFSEVEINEGTYATEITFLGKQVGTTTVVIGNKTYNIEVTPAEAPEMENVTIEYWITNNKAVDQSDQTTDSYVISYDNEMVAKEEGLEIKDYVAQHTYRKTDQGTVTTDADLVFWRTSINTEGYKQEVGQIARTTAGVFFDRIRFWNGKWSVSGDGVAWRDLEATDQLVAYYIQKTDVTQEVITYAMDWGVPNPTGLNGGAGYNAYDDTTGKDYSYVLLDFAVQYESGLRTPDDFPLEKTIGFHCDHADINVAKAVGSDVDGNWYRKLGVIQAEAIEGFEVYMITLTPHTDDKTAMLSDLATDATEADPYSYEGTEKVVWIDDEANLGMFEDESLHAEGYHVGGTPYVPEITIYEHQAMLVTYYVRVVEPENALEVHYHDATGLDTSNPETLENAPEFYMYNISVKGDTVFPEAGTIYVGNDGKLYGATVENSLEVTETVTSVLSDMPAIPVQYRYGQYTFATFSLKNNNTQLHLYYTSTDPIYVVDFGLSVDVDLELDENLDAEILAKPKYGTAEIKDGVLTYKPTTVICNIDVVTVKVIAENQDGSTDTVNRTYRFYPATTVYYEEGFMNIANSSWGEAGTALSDKQTTTLLGQEVLNYGYDAHYSTQENGASNGTWLVSTDPSGYAEFTFTGTGVDIYANCTPDSGSINVLVRNSAGKLVKMLQINTKMAEDGSATGGQAVNAYNIPVASIDFGTTHDTYTVQIRHIKTVVNNSPASSPVQLDGFRVYNTLQDSNVYKDDKEANPTFVEVRDMIFGGFGAESIAAAVEKDENNPSSGSDYFEDYTAEQLGKAMSQVLNLSGGASGVDSTATALIIDGNQGHDNTYVQDLLDNGPKNEVYLFPGQVLTFKPKAGIDVQVGLKAINAAVTCDINGEERVISSSTDMFYELGTMDGTTAVTITNVSGGILSITDMKWMSSDTTGNPEAEPVMMLEEADFVRTFMLMGFRSSTPAPEPEPVVEEEILYQTNNNSTDVRLIAYLDDLSEYEKVAFTLTIDGRTSKELVCSAAYTELYAGGELYTTEDIYGVDGYFVTYTINRYLEVYAGKEVTITVTYTTVTGETVTAERTVTIE